MLRRLLLIILPLLSFLSLLLIGIFFAETYVFDNYLGKVINRVENRVRGLDIHYDVVDQSFLQRKLKVYVTLNKSIKDFDKLSFAFDLQVNFVFLGANGTFKADPGYGNLNLLLKELNLSSLDFEGYFNVSGLKRKALLTARSNSLILPHELMFCTFGQNELSITASSLERADISLRGQGIKCDANDYYNNQKAFTLKLENYSMRLQPEYRNKHVFLDDIVFNLDSFDFDFSTLYALGFTDADKVHDKSIRDRISFSDIRLVTSSTDKDSSGFSNLHFLLNGNYAFFFPYIKDNQVQAGFDFNDLKLDLALSKINLLNLKKLSSINKENMSSVLKDIIGQSFAMKLNSFDFMQKGGRFVNSGGLSFNVGGEKMVKDIRADFSFKGDRYVLDALAREYHFNKEMQRLVDNGSIRAGSSYESRLLFDGSGIYLNGIKQ